MKKKIITISAVLLLFASITLLLFSPISKYFTTMFSNIEIQRFDDSVNNVNDGSYQKALNSGKIDNEGYQIDNNGKRISDTPILFKADLENLYKDSVTYNESLKKHQGIIKTEDFQYSALNLNNYGIYNGIYGYISAPSIGMKLPIFLGANDTNMSYGACHCINTSLPIGGDSTNTVIAAHTGYIGRIFFDYIRNLNKGDEVSVTNYWNTINYNVIEIKEIVKTETQDIYIKKGKELLTLITCISDGNGDFNRLEVVCERK